MNQAGPLAGGVLWDTLVQVAHDGCGPEAIWEISVRCCPMNVAAHSKFDSFAGCFVRTYWMAIKSDAFSMPPHEPVSETIDELLSEISHRTEFRREDGLHLLHMTNTHGDWWRFTFRASGQRWELVGASARSLSKTPHDLLGPIYSHEFAPLLRHVERVANDTKSI
jgi:hypothetical protein